jgi:hypothetical protein
MGIAREVAERLLNHAKPNLQRTYDRGDYREQVAAALEAWAQRVERIVAGEGNVVEMSAARAGAPHA